MTIVSFLFNNLGNVFRKIKQKNVLLVADLMVSILFLLMNFFTVADNLYYTYFRFLKTNALHHVRENKRNPEACQIIFPFLQFLNYLNIKSKHN